MSEEFQEYTQRNGYGSATVGVEAGVLVWVKHNGKKFDVVPGNKYKVSYDNPQRMMHKNAVGIYIESRNIGSCNCDYRVMAILECCGKKFQVEATVLMPWDGQICKEHRKLISPKKKYHLMRNGQCACKCGEVKEAESRMLCDEDFMAIAENSRCKNCGYALKREANDK